MKKFMNVAASMVAESLEGFVSAHDSVVIFGAGRKFIRRRHLTPGKVGLISGGGAGHEPMHIGSLDTACLTLPAPVTSLPLQPLIRSLPP